jgi:hypothetical protein
VNKKAVYVLALSGQAVFFYKAAGSLRSDCVLAAEFGRALSSHSVQLRKRCEVETGQKQPKNIGHAAEKQFWKGLTDLEILLAGHKCTV